MCCEMKKKMAHYFKIITVNKYKYVFSTRLISHFRRFASFVLCHRRTEEIIFFLKKIRIFIIRHLPNRFR